MIRPFLIALQFLTRLPVRLGTQPCEKDIGHSLLYYPLVGLIIATLLALLGWLLNSTSPLIVAALLVTVWILLTGGLHLDGLADSADAWVGGMGDSKKTLAIMKDPACGPAGVVAIVVIILLKFCALHALLLTNEWAALFLTVIIARTLLPVLLLTTPYVRANGLGSALSQHHPRRLSIIVIAVTSALILLTTKFYGFWLLISAITVFLLLRHMMLRRIGGTTGDTAGALVEVTETVVLLIAALTKV